MRHKKHFSTRCFFLGFDGGGTKTDCVLVDARGVLLATAVAGPSNPLRGGYSKTFSALREAASAVIARLHLKSGDIRGICAGIAGAGDAAVVRRVAAWLERTFPNAAVEVTTDLTVALEAAVGEAEGIVLVAGTGSAAFGRNAEGRTARAGGRGPWFSDEGSAFDIGRRALAAIVRADERRGPATALADRIFEHLGYAGWADLIAGVMENPDEVFPGIFPLVASLAAQGDAVSREILSGAAESLAKLVASALENLEMQDRAVPIAKAGGTIGRSKFFDEALDAALHRIAPQAPIVLLEITPAEAAARRSLRLHRRKRDAG